MQASAQPGQAPVSVLFVCLGNICRSPMAEAIFRRQVAERGLGDQIDCDSAGTANYHVGSAPHHDTLAELARRGTDAGTMRARQVADDDPWSFTHVLALDAANLADLQSRFPDADNISLLMSWADAPPPSLDVPDPYYEGGFDLVYDLLESACAGLLDQIA